MLTKLHIKNMVCQRCIEAVSEEFNRLGITIKSIRLGEVVLEAGLGHEEKEAIKKALATRGFELLESRNSQFIERIKNLLIKQIHYELKPLKVNYSTFLERKIGKDYHSLSTLFSSVEGITIERFIILQKIEKVKELLIYDELSLSQISHRLDYSSVHHLSNQFKKATGLSPSQFKKNHFPQRRSLDNLNS